MRLGRGGAQVEAKRAQLLLQRGAQALAMLQQKHYALFITDMARVENGRRIKDAGVHTVREVRQVQPELPIIVYCSKDTVASYGTEAEAAGARVITTSGTSLLAAINKLLHEGRGDGPQPPAQA